jgi:hypothetical protein
MPRNMYNFHGIDLASQRSKAIRVSKSESETVTIHIHRYGESCENEKHEYYFNGDQVEQVSNNVSRTEL